MTAKEHKRLDYLKRRMTWLESRIAKNSNVDLSYDKEEVSALKWAISFIEGALSNEHRQGT